MGTVEKNTDTECCFGEDKGSRRVLIAPDVRLSAGLGGTMPLTEHCGFLKQQNCYRSVPAEVWKSLLFGT